ncbi:hypothetical protein I7I48_05941 [Histoplasma ohiense]|nr:hypothetical protein I7I48_05941 [Histoplasma ohiense (nom. inval.)]
MTHCNNPRQTLSFPADKTDKLFSSYKKKIQSAYIKSLVKQIRKSAGSIRCSQTAVDYWVE